MKTIFYFTAEWCSPCKQTKPIAEDLNRDQVAKFQFIDVDTEIELVKQFNIKSVPTFIIFDESGNETNRIIGGKTKKELEDFING